MLEILVILTLLGIIGVSVCITIFISSTKKQYIELFKENSNNQDKIIRLEDDYRDLTKVCHKLENRIYILENKIEKLENENDNIKKTLEFYNMIAPNFKLEKPFAMKIVK